MLSEYEAAYVQRALRLWVDWAAYCREQKLAVVEPKATQLALRVWIRGQPSKTGPLAAYHAAQWWSEQLKAPILLEGVPRPKAKPKNKDDTGQQQAVVGEPGMLVSLEKIIESLARSKDWPLAAACCTHAVAAAVMRMGHIERSAFGPVGSILSWQAEELHGPAAGLRLVLP